MAKIKYVPNLATIYIVNPVKYWANLKNDPEYISDEMYSDLLFINSGACMLHDKIGSQISGHAGIGYNKIVFLYPRAEIESVCDHLYNRLRGKSSNGITFRDSFRFSVVKVSAEEVDLTEDLIGLQIRFIK